jgi:hypothetical protein
MIAKFDGTGLTRELKIRRHASEHIGAEVPVLAVRATSADRGGLRKSLVFDHAVHRAQSGARFGKKALGHCKPECEILRNDENETGRDGLGEVLGDKKRIARKLEQMIPMWPSGRVLEVHRIARIGRLDQQIKSSCNIQLRRMKPDSKMTLSLGQSILAKSSTPL